MKINFVPGKTFNLKKTLEGGGQQEGHCFLIKIYLFRKPSGIGNREGAENLIEICGLGSLGGYDGKNAMPSQQT